MKKVILLSAFFLALVSCSAPAPTEVVAPAVDTTCVVPADSACAAVCDSAKVDTTKVK